MCSKGWTGPTCETVHCATPCQHDGICVGGSCYCKFGWSGIACEEPQNVQFWHIFQISLVVLIINWTPSRVITYTNWIAFDATEIWRIKQAGLIKIENNPYKINYSSLKSTKTRQIRRLLCFYYIFSKRIDMVLYLYFLKLLVLKYSIRRQWITPVEINFGTKKIMTTILWISLFCNFVVILINHIRYLHFLRTMNRWFHSLSLQQVVTYFIDIHSWVRSPTWKQYILQVILLWLCTHCISY